MAHGYGFTRRWLTLRPTVYEKPKPGQPLPSLLLELLLLPQAAPAALPSALSSALPSALSSALSPPQPSPLLQAIPWPPPIGDAQNAMPGYSIPTRGKLVAYELRLLLFQARNLPATDDNGVTDAFAIAKIGHQLARSSVQRATTSPQWYEALGLHACILCMHI